MADDSTTHRVLVVDDNRSIHSDITKILAPSSTDGLFDAADAEILGLEVQQEAAVHFDLSSAYRGEEGFDLVKEALEEQRPFQLAFVDMRMPPGWDGLETIENIWRVDPDLHAVICTAYSDHSWEQITQRLGRSDRLLILKKPFDSAEVIQIAHALCQKWEIQRRTRRRLNELESRVSSGSVAYSPDTGDSPVSLALATRLVGAAWRDAQGEGRGMSRAGRAALAAGAGLLDPDSEASVTVDAGALLDAIIASRVDMGTGVTARPTGETASIECLPSRLAIVIDGAIDVARSVASATEELEIVPEVRPGEEGVILDVRLVAPRETDVRRRMTELLGSASNVVTTVELDFGGRITCEEESGSTLLRIVLPGALFDLGALERAV